MADSQSQSARVGQRMLATCHGEEAVRKTNQGSSFVMSDAVASTRKAEE